MTTNGNENSLQRIVSVRLFLILSETAGRKAFHWKKNRVLCCFTFITIANKWSYLKCNNSNHYDYTGKTHTHTMFRFKRAFWKMSINWFLLQFILLANFLLDKWFFYMWMRCYAKTCCNYNIYAIVLPTEKLLQHFFELKFHVCCFCGGCFFLLRFCRESCVLLVMLHCNACIGIFHLMGKLSEKKDPRKKSHGLRTLMAG